MKYKPKSYNPKIVTAYYRECGLPEPQYEYFFHPQRKWRFDVAWPQQKIAIEVDGGIWVGGGHNRGGRMKLDWEKRNTAAVMGWRILTVEPSELCMNSTATLLRKAFYPMLLIPDFFGVQ